MRELKLYYILQNRSIMVINSTQGVLIKVSLGVKT